MSSEVSKFITLDDLKDDFDILDNNDDEELTQIRDASNVEVTTRLKAVADKLPLTITSVEYLQAKECARIYALFRWKRKKKQYEEARDIRAEFESKINALIIALQAAPQDRTKRIMVGKDPRKEKLLIPSQKDTFYLDTF